MMFSSILLCVTLATQVLGELQEMSWPLNEQKMTYYPGVLEDPGNLYKHQIDFAGPYHDLEFHSYGSYSVGEHVGTHMDAPYQYYKEGKHINEIPLEDLTGPLVPIDISEKAKKSNTAMVNVNDLKAWEKKYGRIPDRAFVLMYSGWDAYYGKDDAKYLGSTNGTFPVHFPSFDGDAAKWLLDNRDILGIGVDTISCDWSYPPRSHLTMLPANKVCIENLRNVGKVPKCGARFMMLPLMLYNGTGAQGRALAEWYPGVGYGTSCKGQLQTVEDLFNITSSAFQFHPSQTYFTMTIIVCLVITKTVFSFALFVD